jgi:hypothetical protein
VLRRRRSIAWRKLAGSNDGDRQMVKILAPVLTDGLPAVRSACGGKVGHTLKRKHSNRDHVLFGLSFRR